MSMALVEAGGYAQNGVFILHGHNSQDIVPEEDLSEVVSTLAFPKVKYLEKARSVLIRSD